MFDRTRVARPQSDRQAGFTLIEIAIVLVIIGLLLGLGADFLGSYMEKQRYQEINDKLSAIDQALIRFVSVTERLPCPDTDDPADGVADGTPGSCDGAGTVPWEDLGIAASIADTGQGSVIGYAVADDVTDTGGMIVEPDPSDPNNDELREVLRKMGLKVTQGSSPARTLLDPDPSSAPMPTGAAYVLMPENLWKSGSLSVSAADEVNIPDTAISRLVRRPTVAELASRANTLGTNP